MNTSGANQAIDATEVYLDKVITYFLNPIYQIVVVVAFLYFLFGIVFFLFQMNNPDMRDRARSHLFYGLIGLFIILSVGAIIRFFNDLVDGGLVY